MWGTAAKVLRAVVRFAPLTRRNRSLVVAARSFLLSLTFSSGREGRPWSGGWRGS
ncbi:MAG: hypothetical protein BroJett003_26310 [Planctomycetota bacterium]|nr:MAG: hypothetical protein BroJett003_26310 [Planctomycetota bacterium]